MKMYVNQFIVNQYKNNYYEKKKETLDETSLKE